MDASNEMLQSSYHLAREDTLRSIVRNAHQLLEVEACGIFLAAKNSSDEVELAVSYNDMKGFNHSVVRRKIQSVKRGGLIGHFADRKEIICLYGDDLATHPYRAGRPTDYLASNAFYSVLGVPIIGRKGHFLGLLKADNRKGSDGKPSKTITFSQADILLATLFVDQAATALDNLRTFEALNSIVQIMQVASNPDRILETILNQGTILLHADQGDLALWDEATQDLIIAATTRPTSLQIGQSVPHPSVARAVWESGKNSLFVPDVSQESNYHMFSSQTRSEIAVCLETEGRKIGVLNVESFQLDGLDEQDLKLMDLLAQYATFAIQMTGRVSSFRDVVGKVAESRRPQEILKTILESVRSIYGLGSSIIYIADDKKRVLRCLAYINEESVNIQNSEDFSYSYNEIGFATKVFRSRRGLFADNPFSDPDVNPMGLKAFKINSSIIGLPLKFGEKIVGVLVAWSNRNKDYPTKEQIISLEPFARLSAATISTLEAERQNEIAFRVVSEILTHMQTELSLEVNLRFIAHGVQAIGFDRVRVYRYDYEREAYVGLDSLGLQNPERFKGFGVPLEGSVYSAHIAGIALDNQNAQIFDPTSPNSFGVHPYAKELEKADDLPWASVPLVIAGRLNGQIAADNAITGRAISEDSLRFLTLLGALAAQAIANAETIEMLRASKLKDEFLQRMAHIFGTSTASIQLLVDNIQDGVVSSNEALREYIPLIAKLNERFLGLAQNLADFAALREDIILNVVSTDLVVLIEDTINLLQTQAKRKRILFKTDFDRPSVLWEVDAVRVTNAIEVLIDNAIKFSPTGSTIAIDLRISHSTASILVQDEGPGIPKKELRLIFDSFYRGQKAQKEHIDGTGLGLAIVEQTMKLHHGQVEAQNLPNGGAEFRLTFQKQSKEI